MPTCRGPFSSTRAAFTLPWELAPLCVLGCPALHGLRERAWWWVPLGTALVEPASLAHPGRLDPRQTLVTSSSSCL